METRYITDKDGERVGVILDVEEYEGLMEAVENYTTSCATTRPVRRSRVAKRISYPGNRSKSVSPRSMRDKGA